MPRAAEKSTLNPPMRTTRNQNGRDSFLSRPLVTESI